jgi:hypothetical protein
MSIPAPDVDRKRLPDELLRFLTDLSLALQKHVVYPGGHPVLTAAIDRLAERGLELLDRAGTVSIGVARQQLVIEGVASDPNNLVLRDLSYRLHRRHVGGLTLAPGLTRDELSSLLEYLALNPDTARDDTSRPALPHVRLHALAFDRLSIVDDDGEAPPASDGRGVEEGGTREAQLWLGLAAAAMAMGGDDPPVSTDPTVIAAAIDQRQGNEAYDQIIVGYLLQIARELATAGPTEAAELRRRASSMIRALQPATLRRLLSMGGDGAQRQRFVVDASRGLAADAVVEILQAAADTSEQSVSHGLIRMLWKMARHAQAGPDTLRPRADAALRRQVERLVSGWSLENPNPDAYVATLRAVAAAPGGEPAGRQPRRAAHPAEPLRIVQMAIEVDAGSPAVRRAARALVNAGHLSALLDALDLAPADSQVARSINETLASEHVVRKLLRHEPIDLASLDRLLPRIGDAAVAPLLDALTSAESRSVRRKLFERLAKLGPAIGPAAVARLTDDRWFVVRNMLALIESLPEPPPGFSAAPFRQHADVRVQREALRIQLKTPGEREAALVATLKENDASLTGIALASAQHGYPPEALPFIVAVALDPGRPVDERTLGIRALGRARAPEALDALISLAIVRGRWLRGPSLNTASSLLPAVLGALAAGWNRHPRAAEALALAAEGGLLPKGTPVTAEPITR